MKKKLLKSITLALSMLPMTALHAMDEQPNTQVAAHTNNNQDHLKKFIVLGIALPSFTIATTAIHEGGHALMASLIKPGCVEKFHIGLDGSGFVQINDKGMNALAKIAIDAAGPITGGLFSYGCVKVLHALNIHIKKQNQIGDALTANPQPINTPSVSIITDALGVAADLNVASNILQLCCIPGMKTDGSRILATALIHEPITTPLRALAATAIIPAIPLWDLAIFKSMQFYISHASYPLYEKIKLPEKQPQNLNSQSAENSIRNPFNAFRKAANTPIFKIMLGSL